MRAGVASTRAALHAVEPDAARTRASNTASKRTQPTDHAENHRPHEQPSEYSAVTTPIHRENMKIHAKKMMLAAGAVVGTSLLAAAWALDEGRANVWMAEDLIGYQVHNERGEQIGKLEDIIVTPRQGHSAAAVLPAGENNTGAGQSSAQDSDRRGRLEGQENSYAVLSLGSWANMADRYCALPWSVLHTTEANVSERDGKRKLVLMIDKELLRTAPNFEKRTWPDMTNAAWRTDVDTFYRTHVDGLRSRNGATGSGSTGATGSGSTGSTGGNDGKGGERGGQDGRDQRQGQLQDADARMQQITWRVSELDGADIVSPSNEKLGEIEEIAIDTDGHFCYVAVSAGGFLGMGEHVVAVPWESLQFTMTDDNNESDRRADEKDKSKPANEGKRVITLNATKELLERAPEFSNDKEDAVRMSSKEWIATVYQHFSVKPYWDDMKGQKPATPGTPARPPAGK